MDYWKECIEEAFEDAGIKATQEQIETVTNWVEGAHDNYSMAHGYDVMFKPSKLEKPKGFNFGTPHCHSRDGLQEHMTVTCKNTGHVFYFESRAEAERFIIKNG